MSKFKISLARLNFLDLVSSCFLLKHRKIFCKIGSLKLRLNGNIKQKIKGMFNTCSLKQNMHTTEQFSIGKTPVHVYINPIFIALFYFIIKTSKLKRNIHSNKKKEIHNDLKVTKS